MQVLQLRFHSLRLLRMRNESPTEASNNILKLFEKSAERVRESKKQKFRFFCRFRDPKNVFSQISRKRKVVAL